MTVRELCALADQLRKAEPGSRAHRRLCDQMAIASWYLEHSGVLWCMGLEQHPPPGFGPEPEGPPPSAPVKKGAEVVEFPHGA